MPAELRKANGRRGPACASPRLPAKCNVPPARFHWVALTRRQVGQRAKKKKLKGTPPQIDMEAKHRSPERRSNGFFWASDSGLQPQTASPGARLQARAEKRLSPDCSLSRNRGYACRRCVKKNGCLRETKARRDALHKPGGWKVGRIQRYAKSEVRLEKSEACCRTSLSATRLQGISSSCCFTARDSTLLFLPNAGSTQDQPLGGGGGCKCITPSSFQRAVAEYSPPSACWLVNEEPTMNLVRVSWPTRLAPQGTSNGWQDFIPLATQKKKATHLNKPPPQQRKNRK